LVSIKALRRPSIYSTSKLSWAEAESQEDVLPDDRARVEVPMLARMLWEEIRERPTAS
jgi:hypothetical protein